MANVAKIVSKIIKAAEKKPVRKLAEPSKASVKVKPAAKNVPNPPNKAKALEQGQASGGRAYNKASREYEQGAGKYGNMYEQQDAAREAMFKAPIGRKTSIALKKLTDAEALKATTPRTKDATWSTKKPIKIKSNQLGGQHMGGHAPLKG